MIKNQIGLTSSGLRGITKAGPYCVTRARLGDLNGRHDLPLADYRDDFLGHEAELAKEADRLRRHGHADPTGLVILDRKGTRLIFGKMPRA